MEEILISTQPGRIKEFEKDLAAVMARGQLLVDMFQSFQPFKKIETKDQFFSLLRDPLGEYDRAIVGAVDLKAGSLAPDPEAVAIMFNLPRIEYMSLVKGQAVNMASCTPCKALKGLSIGKPAISLTQFKLYADYIIFDNGQLTFNPESVEAKKRSFSVRASSPESVEYYKYWQNVCDTLNSLNQKGYLSQTLMLTIQDGLQRRLMFSYATGRLHLNNDILIHEILQRQ